MSNYELRILSFDFHFGIIENKQIGDDESIIAPFDLINLFKCAFNKQTNESNQKQD